MGTKRKGFLYGLNGFFYFLLLGVFLSFINGLVPRDYFLFLLYYFFVSGKHVLFSVQSFLIYSIVLSLPIAAVWMAAIWIEGKKENFVNRLNYLVNFRRILSVILLTLGVGLIILNII